MGHEETTWAALAALGVFHGVNPAMGWLFAVALGLQEGSRRAVAGALLPIAVGHEASVLLLALLVTVAGGLVAPEVVAGVGGLLLVGFGAYLLLRRRHFRWVGMRLSRLELAQWSFLVATAHGAGLMLLPVLSGGHGAGLQHLLTDHGLAGSLGFAATAALVHGGATLLTTGVVAVLVYDAIGLGVLRSSWVDLDKVWAAALVAAGVFTLVPLGG